MKDKDLNDVDVTVSDEFLNKVINWGQIYSDEIDVGFISGNV